MRFKAVVSHVDKLHGFCMALSKASKECILMLDETTVKFIARGDNRMQVWASVNKDSVFDTYTIESKLDNLIAFRLQIDILERAFQSAKDAKKITMKLAKKKDIPYLEVLADGSGSMHSCDDVHDVPIALLSKEAIAECIEPQLQNPEVYICLPESINVVQKIVERLQRVSSDIAIWANMHHRMRLSVDTDVAAVEAHFANLSHPSLVDQPNVPLSAETVSEVVVEAAHLSKLMHIGVLQPSSIVLCLVRQQSAAFHVLFERNTEIGSYATYYLPAKHVN